MGPLDPFGFLNHFGLVHPVLVLVRVLILRGGGEQDAYLGRGKKTGVDLLEGRWAEVQRPIFRSMILLEATEAEVHKTYPQEVAWRGKERALAMYMKSVCLRQGTRRHTLPWLAPGPTRSSAKARNHLAAAPPITRPGE